MDTLIKVKNRILGTDKKEEDNYDFCWDFISERDLFNFYENDIVYSSFEFDDTQIKLEYEHPITGEYESIKTGEEIELHYFGKENSYYIGSFDFRATYNDKQYTGIIKVSPKSFYTEDVYELRRYVNDFYNGLSLNLNKRRKVSIGLNEINGGVNNTFINYSYIESNYPKILNQISHYIQIQPEKIIKKSQPSRTKQKIDPKTIKWLAQKGNQKNNDLRNPEVLMINKTVPTVDFDENQYFKSIVKFWETEIIALITQNKNVIDKLRVLEYNEKARQKNASEKYNVLSQDSKKFNKEIGEQKAILKDTEEKLEELNNAIKNYDGMLKTLKHFYVSINRMLNFTWLTKVSDKTGSAGRHIKKETAIIKEQKDKYLESKHRKTQSGETRIDYFAEKSTPKLFETYVFIVLIHLFERLGYYIDPDSDLVFDLMYALSFQSTIKLKRETGEYIHIIYDRQLEKFSKSNIENDYCTINSIHNKPDFIVSLHDKEGERINTFIFEVKWRSFKYIYDESGDTKVVDTLRDYLNLGYCVLEDSKCKLNKGIVDKVFVLYPDEDESLVEIVDDNIYGIGIKIDNNVNNSSNINKIIDIITQ